MQGKGRARLLEKEDKDKDCKQGLGNGAVGKEHIPRTCVISNTHVKAAVSVTPALGKQTGDPLNLWADSVV